MWRGDGVGRDRATGKWLYKFYSDGILYRKRGFPTQRSARQACTAKRTEIRDRPPGEGADITFKDARAEYLHHHAPPRLAQATYDKYTYVLDMMSSRWGTLPLRALTSHMVEDYCRWRLSTPVFGKYVRRASGASVNRDLVTLSAFLSWAHMKPRRWVTENVCKDVERFDEPRTTYQPIPPADRKAMAEILGPEAVKADLLHALGVRVGVVLGLRWEQVDFETRTLTYRSKGREVTRFLGGRAMAILRTLEPRPGGYVFRSRSGTTFRRYWKKAALAVGRPKARPHDLRITFAREMADSGVDTSTIRDMLGHSTTTMTERYIGSSRQAQELATKLHDARAGFA